MENELSKTEQPCTMHGVMAPLVIGCLTITPFEDDDYMRITIEGAYEEQTELVHKKDLWKLRDFFNGL